MATTVLKNNHWKLKSGKQIYGIVDDKNGFPWIVDTSGKKVMNDIIYAIDINGQVLGKAKIVNGVMQDMYNVNGEKVVIFNTKDVTCINTPEKINRMITNNFITSFLSLGVIFLLIVGFIYLINL